MDIKCRITWPAITLEQLEERWPCEGRKRIISLVRRGALQLYREDPTEKQGWKNDDGTRWRKVIAVTPEHAAAYDPGSEYWRECVFDPANIEFQESIAPWYRARPESEVTIDESDGREPEATPPSHVAVFQWKTAIATTRGTRRKRLEIWMKRKEGVSLDNLQAEYPTRNINRDIRGANTVDVPALMTANPGLPKI